MGRPPTSTLFPYTTLFRSQRRLVGRGSANSVVGNAGHGTLRDSPRRELDRKSTRLNSSHMSISYAVFCLKKKTRPRDASLMVSCWQFYIQLTQYNPLVTSA